MSVQYFVIGLAPSLSALRGFRRCFYRAFLPNLEKREKESDVLGQEDIRDFLPCASNFIYVGTITMILLPHGEGL